MFLKIEEQVLLDNDDFIVINKPPGLLSIQDRAGKEISLKQILLQKFENIFTVHRLDKETSGIIVFAKNEEAHKHLSQQFEKRQTVKIYNGFVLGIPAEKIGVINEPIAEHPVKKGSMTVHKKGKESITNYEVLDSFRFYSWMQFQILTGRTHQIRVHMKHLGHPIVCDPLYGDGKPILMSQLKPKYNLSKSEEEEKPILNRVALHASELKFTNIKGEVIELKATLPKDLKATLNQLQKIKIK
jgi:23S rRNA pseudouridine1911/1915/1917 synthase